jgi:hypothetical protein
MKRRIPVFLTLTLALTIGATAAAQSPAPAPLPGKGLAQHPFLYCGEWQDKGESEQTMFILRGGKVVWQYSIPAKEESRRLHPIVQRQHRVFAPPGRERDHAR